MTGSVDGSTGFPPVSVILAQDANNGVGYKGKLRGKTHLIKNDMKMFRELTTWKTRLHKCSGYGICYLEKHTK